MLILKELSNYLITIEHVVLMVLSWSSSSGGYGHNAGSAKVLFTRMCCALVEIAQYFIEGRMHRKTWLKPSFHWIDGTTDTLKGWDEKLNLNASEEQLGTRRVIFHLVDSWCGLDGS
ncbi:DNA polymerase delta catalytic subunit [Olea europaea subsp. europaea]|uniref:DNA polymerase delta catalytic subunit n=1 Tax=Olea europaea subsp. europaea TaxID=158383 RepID=A0A8S0RY50_OLEEU|nr:DNA polymerase delta catalytic subunit [Olea europaea subsp. europaea]